MDDFGYMWECPNLVKVSEDKYAFLFSPQGLKEEEFKKKDYLTKYFLIYKNNKIKGAIELNYKERDFVISTIKFISKKEFKLFLFKFYKNLYLRINPVNLYIYINDVSFLNEFNLTKIKKDLYLLNINPIDIEKLLKKSHK